MSRYYHVLHLGQARAKWTVRNRVRRGKLIKPDTCERCDKHYSKKFIEGHHWSYKKEHHADVIWLCRWCHKKVHVDLGPDWVDAEVRPDLRLRKEPEAPFVPSAAVAAMPDIY